MVNWRQHIITDPEIQNGRPVIKNTRITVDLILEKLSEGESVDQLLESHPRISLDSIYACLSFASEYIKNEITYPIAS